MPTAPALSSSRFQAQAISGNGARELSIRRRKNRSRIVKRSSQSPGLGQPRNQPRPRQPEHIVQRQHPIADPVHRQPKNPVRPERREIHLHAIGLPPRLRDRECVMQPGKKRSEPPTFIRLQGPRDKDRRAEVEQQRHDARRHLPAAHHTGGSRVPPVIVADDRGPKGRVGLSQHGLPGSGVRMVPKQASPTRRSDHRPPLCPIPRDKIAALSGRELAPLPLGAQTKGPRASRKK